MLSIFAGDPPGPDDDWSIQEPVVDSFTDEIGQTATLNGIDNRLVLIVACNAGRILAIGLGGLSARTMLFQDGSVDMRWADGPVSSQGWTDSDSVLVVPEQHLPGFLEAATTQLRLRIRANVVRNQFVQDEFNLANLNVSAGSLRMIAPARGNREREELTCTR